MQPFNPNNIVEGQPAIIINVEFSENSEFLGRCAMVDTILKPGELKSTSPHESYTWISFSEDKRQRRIITRYLMPIPPLNDDVLEQTNVKQPEGEKA
jgi:hypothetical protein